MKTIPALTLDADSLNPSWKIGIVRAQWHKEEVDGMVESAVQTLKGHGIENIEIHEASGCFEIPLIGAALASTDDYDALMGFGVILEGATGHASLLAESVTRGLMQVQLSYQIPFAFEILHVSSIEQAKERAHGEGSKGKEAAQAALHSLVSLEKIAKEAMEK